MKLPRWKGLRYCRLYHAPPSSLEPIDLNAPDTNRNRSVSILNSRNSLWPKHQSSETNSLPSTLTLTHYFILWRSSHLVSCISFRTYDLVTRTNDLIRRCLRPLHLIMLPTRHG